MTQTEALKLLVEALSLYETRTDGLVNKALAVGKEALAQPDQYAKGYADAMNWKTANHLEHLPAQPEQEFVDYRAMYLKVRDELAELQQRTWVGLTDEDIERIKLLTFEKEINTNGEEQEAVNLDQLIRAAEQLCKEKNNV